MKDSKTAKVTSVACEDQDVIIEFSDGHRAIFEGYTHGWGYQIEGLRRFSLYLGEEEVVRYDSRLHRFAPNDDEYRFVHVANGYTLEQIIHYWESAAKYINEEYFEKPYKRGKDGRQELWRPWIITGKGKLDLQSIKEGLKPLPVP